MSNHLRPRTTAELLDLSFAIVRAHATPLGVLATIAAFPLLAGGALLAPAAPDLATTVGLRIGFPLASLAGALLTLAGALWMVVASASLVHATAAAFRGEPVEPAAALRAAGARAWRILGSNLYKYVMLWVTWFAVFLLVMLLATTSRWAGLAALLLAMTGMLVVIGRASVVTPVALLEDVKVTGVFDRSMTLTRGGTTRIALLLLGVFGVGGASALSLAWASTLVSAPAAAALLDSLWVLIFPLGSVFETVIYLDQRIRLEGYDLELMAGQLDGGATPSTAAAAPRRQPA